MKNTKKSTERNLEGLISKLSGNELLNLKEMMFVRGGGGDGGGIPIVPPPPPPPPPPLP